MKLLISMMLILTISLSANEDQWNQVRDRNNIQIYNRSIEGINFKEFMGEAKIEAPLEDIMRIFDDVELGTYWIENVDQMKKIEEVDENISYTYTYSKAPWPVKDRDAVVYNEKITDGNTVTIIQQARPDKLGGVEGAVRVPFIESSWVFTQEEDRVHVRYQVLTDPGGRLPAWLINKVSVSQPYETLLGLKKLAEGK